MVTGDNLKFGKLITDGQYIHQIIRDMQDIIDIQKDGEGGYSTKELKEIIQDEIDELELYDSDMDYIMSELKF